MSETKKPLPGVPDRGAAAEENGGSVNLPVTLQEDTITQTEPAQGFFEKILFKGAENGRTADDLRRLLGVSNTRLVGRLISRERDAGANILSGPTGYYLPDDGEKGRQEAAAFVLSIKAKGKNTLRAARAAESFLANLPGQMEIGGRSDE